MSGRCMACDAIFTENEIIWDEERNQHEELCTKCRTLIREAEDDMDTSILYPEDDIYVVSEVDDEG